MKTAQAISAAAQSLLAGRHRCVTPRAVTPQLINNACDDGMRDHHSLWGSITGFFSTRSSWVAGTGRRLLAASAPSRGRRDDLAVAGFIHRAFIPGVDVLVDMVATMVLISTIAHWGGPGRRLLLAATGHGVLMDGRWTAVALASFRPGTVAGAGARALVPE